MAMVAPRLTVMNGISNVYLILYANIAQGIIGQIILTLFLHLKWGVHVIADVQSKSRPLPAV